MVVRTLLGDGPEQLTPTQLLDPAQVVLAGVRTGDPSEYEYIAKTGIRTVGVADPEEFGSVCYPEPDGVPSDRLVDLLARLDNVVGVGVTEHAPADGRGNTGEAEVIRRFGTALRRAR